MTGNGDDRFDGRKTGRTKTASLSETLTRASALIWRERLGELPAIATHDRELGLAAKSFGFDVRGI